MMVARTAVATATASDHQLTSLGHMRGNVAGWVAASEGLLHARAEGTISDSVLTWQCTPEAAVVGFDQPIDLEVRERFTQANGIDLGRRLTGGGALLCGEGQILFSIVAKQPT